MVKSKFEQDFVKHRNTIFEYAKFNQRQQKEGESVDSFITIHIALWNSAVIECFETRQNCCWVIRHQPINEIADGSLVDKAMTAAR